MGLSLFTPPCPGRMRRTPKHLDALKHLLVTLGHPLAVVGTLLTDLGTCPACQAMKRTAPRHEIRACGADLSAIQQHPDMSLIRACLPPIPRQWVTVFKQMIWHSVQLQMHSSMLTAMASPSELGEW